MTREKRTVSILIPYRIQGDVMMVYLQKRSPDMKLPNYFGFWGGGVEEGETPEQGLVREIKEELNIDLDLSTAEFFNTYEFIRGIKHVYLFAAPEGWEENLVIGEGEYGKWFSIEEALKLENCIYQDKTVLVDVESEKLNKPIR